MVTVPTEIEFQQLTDARLASEAAELEQRIAAQDRWHEHERRVTVKRRMKQVMAAAAIFATLKSGGFVDMAGDELSDAGDVVASAVDKPQIDIPTELDGIKFEEYPEQTQQEIMNENSAWFEKESAARDTIIDLFRTIDQDGPQQIIAEVTLDHQEHPEMYSNEELVEQTRETIDEAETNEAAIAALNDFMNTYGIEAGFEGTEFTDKQRELKEVLKAYVDVFSPLPKDFIAAAELERVTVSDHAVLSGGPGSESGTYSPNSNSINVVVRSEVMSIGAIAEGWLERDDLSYQATIGHELGHALSEKLGLVSNLSEGEQVDLTVSTPPGPFVSQIGRNIINRPEHMSVYGRTSFGENTAEVLSGLLSDRKNGLAMPEEWRRFGSGANKDMIEMLARLEVRRPGIAKILIADRES